ncbi:MAG: DHA2 family efflux MFS transporter permease subunit, partial [Chloroflexota bacterium]
MQQPSAGIPPANARNKWVVLAAVGLGTFLSVLDSSILNVSLPVITVELGTDLTTVQWVVMAYLLTITGLLLTFGRLADLVGRKKVYVIGMAIFTVTVGASGLARDVGQLIAMRIVEGVGSAMVMALGPALTAGAFPIKERGKALGINAAIVAAGGISGPVLGGLLAEYLDWRWIFYVRVPLCMLATLAAAVILVETTPTARRRFDFGGAALLFFWLACLTLGVNQGRNLGWDSPATIGLFVAAIAGLAAFIYFERNVLEPMLELSVFRNRLFSAASVSSLISFLALFAVTLLMPFYFVQALGYSPSAAGLMLLPQPLVMSIVAPFSGSLSDRFGSRILSTLGLGIASLGLLSISFLDADSSYETIVIRLMLLGLGVGLFGSPNTNALLSALPPNKMGVASGMMATMRNLGMVLGTAVAGAVWTGRMAYY